MITTCKNCNQNLDGNYCKNCGQNVDTHKINVHFLWHDIQHGLFHFDNGIFYTVKELFTRPGNSIRGFIEGKRVKHLKPFSFVITVATFFGLLYHYFHIDPTVSISTIAEADVKRFDLRKINEWISTHYALSSLLFIPLSSIGSYLAFKKTGYNFVEHLVLNTYLAGQRIMLKLIFFPLLYLFRVSPNLLKVTTGLNFIGILLVFWAYFQFFNTLTPAQKIGRTLLCYVYFGIMFLLFSISIVFIIKLF